MVTVSESSDRIDYVRIVVDGDPQAVAGQVEDLSSIAQVVADEHKIETTDFRAWGMFDQATKRHVRIFDVWGMSAEYFVDLLPMTYWRKVIRLDYRCEVSGDAPTARVVFDAMESHKQGKRNTKTEFHNSPIRVKRNGRDAGGTTAVSGGKDSDKRLSYYQRGSKTSAALEGQFSSNVCRMIVQDAYNAYLAVEDKPFVQHVHEKLYTQLNTLCVERVGVTADVIVDGNWFKQETIQDMQESLLSGLDDAWNNMNADAKMAFIESHAHEILPLVGAQTEDPRDGWNDDQYHDTHAA